MKARSCPKLPKGPTVQHAPLALANRFPRAFADALKIFQGNAARGAFGRLHHGLRPTLIHVRGTPPFPAAALREQALARLRALLLELLAEAAEPCPRLVHVPAPGSRARAWFTWACLGPVDWFKNSPSDVAASVMMPRSTPT